MIDEKIVFFEGKTLDEVKLKACRAFSTEENNLEIQVIENTRKIFSLLGGGKIKISAKLKNYILKDEILEVEIPKDQITKAKFAKQILEELVKFFDVNSTIELKEREDEIILNIQSEKSGLIIGKKGETLSSMQFILNKIIQNEEEAEKRIIIDIEGYRDKRKRVLEGLAYKASQQAKKTKKPITLRISSAYERWIVHNSLCNDNEVYTKSVGEGDDRKLMIFPNRKREVIEIND